MTTRPRSVRLNGIGKKETYYQFATKTRGQWSAAKKTMTYQRHLLTAILSLCLLAGCRKADSDQQCLELKQAMETHDVGKAGVIISLMMAKLPSDNYTAENIEALARSISRQCAFTVTVICFDCIDTFPGQTEIRISFISGSSIVSKTIDISHAPGQQKMKFMNMHN